jgi:hypothetical protein
MLQSGDAVFFDKLGDNTSVPLLTLVSGLDIRDQIRRHAREHIVNPGHPVRGPIVRLRLRGGFTIVDEDTGYTYGTARKSPTFTEGPDIPPFAPPAGFQR